MSSTNSTRSPDQRGKAVACGGGLLSGLAFGTAAWLAGGSVNRALKRKVLPSPATL
jgi:hypothetical protein